MPVCAPRGRSADIGPTLDLEATLGPSSTQAAVEGVLTLQEPGRRHPSLCLEPTSNPVLAMLPESSPVTQYHLLSAASGGILPAQVTHICEPDGTVCRLSADPEQIFV